MSQAENPTATNVVNDTERKAANYFGVKNGALRQCEVCGGFFPKDKCVRLTSWKKPETDETEWCCIIDASKAMKRG